jgi:probable rRNA maturation factor
MSLTFQTQEKRFSLKDKSKVREWIKKIITSEKKTLGEINFVFTSDEVVLKANIEYLNHHTYTDIITFDSCEDQVINGDILISLDRVKENAEKFDVSFEDELHRVMIHGILHLCGYKDKTKPAQQLMRKKENLALKKR